MSRLALFVFVLAAVAVAIVPPANAADSKAKVMAPTAAVEETVIIEPAPVITEPLFPAPRVEVAVTPLPPRVQYGCKRVWRCDTVVCEWRRGCWGVYGYMEGPYYTEELAKRQWARDGLPMSETRAPRSRAVIAPSLAK